jgi:hypothetical protein
MGEFARLLFSTAVARDSAGTVRLAFDGGSQWLKDCQTAVEYLPCTQRGGPADIRVTDSSDGPGWHFALNGRRLSAGLHEFFWHAYAGPHAIELSLHSEQGVEGSLRIPPIPGFYWREQHAAAMEAAPALLMVAVMRRAGYTFRPADPSANSLPSTPPPGPVPLNWFRFKKLARSLYLRRPGANPLRRWSIALHANAGGAVPASEWRWTCGFADHEAADPFLALHQERLWLFYEDMLPQSRHGRIAVVPAFDDVTEPSVILEKPYHLSYPHVFEHGGDWFMMPESSANSTVDLYRARKFPYEWEHVKTLIQGPRLVDTTPCFHEGRWYFFTTAILPGRANISLLFVAEALDAPWRLHPASPISGDAAIARGAGPISLWNGRMIRPVQDCLVRYGYSMTLREIVHLSPSAFEDRPMEQILPSWSPELCGTHTFCPAGPALALDGLR